MRTSSMNSHSKQAIAIFLTLLFFLPSLPAVADTLDSTPPACSSHEHHCLHDNSPSPCDQTTSPTLLPNSDVSSPGPSSTESSSSSLPSSFSLDLSTSQQTLAATNTTPVSIQIGGAVGADGLVSGGISQLINPGQLLTPAQFLTLNSLLSGSGQTLVLDTQGSAVGGSLRIDAANINNSLSSLTIPTNVSLASVGFDNSNPLTVVGSALIQGSMYTLQTSANVSSILNFGSLTIDPGGLLSGILPNSMSSFASMAGLFSSDGLTLNVAQDIVNNGTISTIGSLAMNAGGNIFNNGGLITNVTSVVDSTIANMQNLNLFMGNGILFNSGLIAAMDSLNIQTQLGQNLQLLNDGGVLEALNIINVRDSLYTGSADLSLSGGSVISQELNLYSGTGVINANLNAISGTLSTYAGEAHVLTTSDMLTLGNICISGDPTYYNTGNIQLTGDILVSEKLAIVAGGNITATAGLTRISTTDGGGQGYDIQIIAGANVSPACGTCYPSLSGNPASSGSISIDPFLPNGGNIDLSAASPTLAIEANSTTSGLSGGNITMVAFANGANTGWIRLPGTSTVNTSGSGSGNNGNFTAIAGGTNTGTGLSVQLGNIIAGGGTGNDPDTGRIFITTVQPTTSDGLPLVFDPNANVISIDIGTLEPNYFTPRTFTTPTAGGVSVGNITAGSGPINISAGTDITLTGSLINNGHAISLVAGRDIINPGITFIDTSSTTGNGGNLLIAAGAAFNFVGAGANLNISGASTTGGGISYQITVPNGINTGTTASSADAGNVNIIAFANSGGNGGQINMNNIGGGTYNIQTQAQGGGRSGDITIIAGATDGTQLIVGGADTQAIGSSGGGNITITPSTVVVSGGGITVDSSSGTLTGSFSSGTLQNSSIRLRGNILGNGAPVSLLSLASIVIDGDIINSMGQSVTLIAGQNITSATQVGIDTSSTTGNAGHVLMVAGAAFTQSGNDITISGASLTGGQINFAIAPGSGINTTSTAAGGNAGNVNIIALANSGGNGGQITMNNINSLGYDIDTRALAGGRSGDITVIADARDGSTLLTGGANTQAAGSTGGNILITPSLVQLPGGGITVDINTGILSDVFTAGALQDSSITLRGGLLGNGSAVSLVSTGTISFFRSLGNLSGAPISIIAGGDINQARAGSISTSNSAGNGGDVLLVAGAAFTQSGSQITITGPSVTGGSINYTVVAGNINTSSSAVGGNGGNVNVVAFANGSGNGGQINMQPGASGRYDIDTSAGGGGISGDITIIASATNGATLTTGGPVTQSLNSTGGGNIIITPSSVVLPGGGITADFNTGALSDPFSAGTLQNSSITLLGNVRGNGQPINLISYQNITLGGITGTTISNIGGAPISIIAGGNISNSTLSNITLNNASGNGGNLLMVAGAAFTPSGNNILITGPSLTGGSINLAGFNSTGINTSSTAMGGNGGNVNIIAFVNGSGVGGQINMPGITPTTAYNITAASGNGGSSGSITIIASATDGTALTVGGANTQNNTSIGGGNILITPSSITLPGGGITANLNNGSLSSSFSAGSLQNSAIALRGGLVGNGQPVSLVSRQTITLNGSIGNRLGAPVSIISGGSIINESTSASITLSNTAGNAGNLLLVAGALFSMAGSDITITGASTTGGNINFAGITNSGINTSSTAAAGNGGNITLVALAGSGGINGQISMPHSSGGIYNMDTRAQNGGRSGDITVIAGVTDGSPITVGGINAQGSATSTGGSVLVASATVTVPGGGITTNLNSGSMSGAFGTSTVRNSALNLAGGLAGNIMPVLVFSGGSITMNGSISTRLGAPVSIISGGDLVNTNATATINTSSGTTSGGNVLLAAGAMFTYDGTTINLTGSPSSGGGSIILSSPMSTTTQSTAAGNAGGDVTLLAFANAGNGGRISIISSITTGGSGSGQNGSVRIVAGAASGAAINVPSINTTGSSNASPLGNIIIRSANSTSFLNFTAATGNLSSGSFTTGTVLGGGITLDTLTSGNSINLATTDSLTLPAGRTWSAAGPVTINGIAGVTVGTGATLSSGGNITINTGILSHSGAITSSAVNGTITVQNTGNPLTLNGAGGLMSVTGGGANALIMVQALDSSLQPLEDLIINAPYSFSAGSSGRAIIQGGSITFAPGASLSATSVVSTPGMTSFQGFGIISTSAPLVIPSGVTISSGGNLSLIAPSIIINDLSSASGSPISAAGNIGIITGSLTLNDSITSSGTNARIWIQSSHSGIGVPALPSYSSLAIDGNAGLISITSSGGSIQFRSITGGGVYTPLTVNSLYTLSAGTTGTVLLQGSEVNIGVGLAPIVLSVLSTPGTVNHQGYSIVSESSPLVIQSGTPITSPGNLFLSAPSIIINDLSSADGSPLAAAGNISIVTGDLTLNDSVTSSGTNARIWIQNSSNGMGGAPATPSYASLTVDGTGATIGVTSGSSSIQFRSITSGGVYTPLAVDSLYTLTAGITGTVLLRGSEVNIGVGLAPVVLSVLSTPGTVNHQGYSIVSESSPLIMQSGTPITSPGNLFLSAPSIIINDLSSAAGSPINAAGNISIVTGSLTLNDSITSSGNDARLWIQNSSNGMGGAPAAGNYSSLTITGTGAAIGVTSSSSSIQFRSIVSGVYTPLTVNSLYTLNAGTTGTILLQGSEVNIGAGLAPFVLSVRSTPGIIGFSGYSIVSESSPLVIQSGTAITSPGNLFLSAPSIVINDLSSASGSPINAAGNIGIVTGSLTLNDSITSSGTDALMWIQSSNWGMGTAFGGSYSSLTIDGTGASIANTANSGNIRFRSLTNPGGVYTPININSTYTISAGNVGAITFQGSEIIIAAAPDILSVRSTPGVNGFSGLNIISESAPLVLQPGVSLNSPGNISLMAPAITVNAGSGITAAGNIGINTGNLTLNDSITSSAGNALIWTQNSGWGFGIPSSTFYPTLTVSGTNGSVSVAGSGGSINFRSMDASGVATALVMSGSMSITTGSTGTSLISGSSVTTGVLTIAARTISLTAATNDFITNGVLTFNTPASSTVNISANNGTVNLGNPVILNSSSGSVLNITGNGVTTSNIAASGQRLNITSAGSINTGILDTSSTSVAGGNITLDSTTSTFNLGSILTSSDVSAPGSLVFRSNGVAIAQPTVAFTNGSTIRIYGNTSGAIQSLYINLANSNSLGHIYTYNTGTGSGGAVTLLSPGSLNVTQVATFGGSNGGSVSLSASGNINITNGVQTYASAGNGGNINISSPGSITSGALASYSSASGTGGNITLDSATGIFNLSSIYSYSNSSTAGILTFQNNGITIPQPTIAFTNGSTIRIHGNTASAAQSLYINLANSNSLGLIYTYNTGTGDGGGVTLISLGSLDVAQVATFGGSSGGSVSLSADGNINITNGVQTYASAGNGGNINISSPGSITSGALASYSSASGTGGNITLDSATGIFNLSSIYSYSNSSTAGVLTFQNNGITLPQPTIAFTNGSTIRIHGNTSGAIQSLYINLANSNSLGLIYTYNTGTGDGGGVTLISLGSLDVAQVATFGGSSGGSVSLSADGNINITNGVQTYASAGNGGNITIASLTGSATFGQLATATGGPASIDGDIIIDASSINPTSTINARAGRVTLRPNQNGNVTVGGTSSGSPFFISDTLLSIITAGTLEIGNSSYTGTLSLGNSLNVSGIAGTPGVYNLVFNTGGNYTDSGYSLTLGARSLTVDAGTTASTGLVTATTGNIGFRAGTVLTANNNVTTGGGISLASSSVNINSGVSISGLTVGIAAAAPSGSVNLLNNGSITGGNSVSIQAPNGGVSIQAGSTGQISVSNNNASILIGGAGTNTVTINPPQDFTASGSNSLINIESVNSTVFGNIVTFTTGVNSTVNISANNGAVNLGNPVTLNSTSGSVLNIAGNSVITSNIAASGQRINVISAGAIATGIIDTSSSSAAGGDVTLTASGGPLSVAYIIADGNSGGGAVNLSADGDVNITTGAVGIRTYAVSGNAGNINIVASGSITSAGPLESQSTAGGTGGNITLDSGNATFNLNSIRSYSNSGAAGLLTFQQNGVTLAQPTVAFTTGSSIDIHGNTASATQSLSINLANSNSLGIIVANNMGTGAGSNITLISPGALSAAYIRTEGGSGGGSVNLSANGNVSIGTGAVGIRTYASAGTGGDIDIVTPGSITITGPLESQSSGGGTGGNITLDSGTGTFSLGSITTYSNSGAAGLLTFQQNGATLTQPTVAFTTGSSINIHGNTASAAQSLYINLANSNSLGIIVANNIGSGAGSNITLISPGALSAAYIRTEGGSSGGSVNLVANGNVSIGTGAVSIRTYGIDGGSIDIVTPGSIAITGPLESQSAGGGTGGNITLDSGTGTFSLGSINTYSNSGAAGLLTFQQNGVTLTQPTVAFATGSSIDIHGNTASATQSLYINLANPNSLGTIITNNTGGGAGGSITLVSPGDLNLIYIIAEGGSGGGSVNLVANGDINITSNPVGIRTYAATGLGGDINITSVTGAATFGPLNTATSGIASIGGNISINASSINPISTINAKAGQVVLRPNQNGDVTVGGTSSGSPFFISNSILSIITAGALEIGSSSYTGTLSLGDSLNVSGTAGTPGIYNLVLNTGGNYTDNGYALTLGARSLAINAGTTASTGLVTATTGNIDFTAGSTLTANNNVTTGGGISFASPSVNVNSGVSISGLTVGITAAVPNGSVNLLNNGSITGGNSVSIQASNGGVSIQAGSTGQISVSNNNASILIGGAGTNTVSINPLQSFTASGSNSLINIESVNSTAFGNTVTFNTGANSTVNITSTGGSVNLNSPVIFNGTTGSTFNIAGDSVAANNITASGQSLNITSAGTLTTGNLDTSNATVAGGNITLDSATSTFNLGSILTFSPVVASGSLTFQNNGTTIAQPTVTFSPGSSILIYGNTSGVIQSLSFNLATANNLGNIYTYNLGAGSGGSVTLVSPGALTTGTINTSASGGGGSITLDSATSTFSLGSINTSSNNSDPGQLIFQNNGSVIAMPTVTFALGSVIYTYGRTSNPIQSISINLANSNLLNGIRTFNLGPGAGGSVTLISPGTLTVAEIATHGQGGGGSIVLDSATSSFSLGSILAYSSNNAPGSLTFQNNGTVLSQPTVSFIPNSTIQLHGNTAGAIQSLSINLAGPSSLGNIYTYNTGSGSGGSITFISPGSFSANLISTFGAAGAGSVSLTADGSLTVNSITTTSTNGNGGSINLISNTSSVVSGALNSFATGSSGDIIIDAASVSLSSTINAGSSRVLLRPSQNGDVTIGGMASGSPFFVSNTVLSNITASTLEIGSSSYTGALSLGDSLNVAGTTGSPGVYDLVFNTGGDYTDNGYSLTLGARSLNVSAGGTADTGLVTATTGNISFTTGSVLTANNNVSTGGLVSFASPSVAVNPSVSVSGSTVTITPSTLNGSLNLTNDGSIIGANSVTIQAPNGDITLQSSANGQISVTSNNGAILIGGSGTSSLSTDSSYNFFATGSNSSIRLEATGTVDLNQSLTFNTGANGQAMFSSTAGILNANASNVFNAGTNTSILFNGQNSVNFASGTTQSNPNGSLSATAASGSIAVNSNATLQSINGNLSLANSGGTLDISEGVTLRASTSLAAGGATNISLSGASGVNISSAGASGTTTIMAGTLTGGADPYSTDINAYDLSAVSSTGAITINSANSSVIIGDNVNITSIAANINVNAGQDFTVGQGNAIMAQGGNIGINAVNNLSLGVNGGAFTSMQAIARYNPNLAPFIIDGETIPAYQGSGIGIYIGSGTPPNWDADLPDMQLNRVAAGYVNVSGMPGGNCPTCSAPNGGQLEIIVTGTKTITANNVSATADGGVIWIDPPDMFLNNISFFAAGPSLTPPPVPPVPPAPPSPGGTATVPAVIPVSPLPVSPPPAIILSLPASSLASAAVPTDITRHFSIPLSSQHDRDSDKGISRIAADTRIGTYHVANDTCQPFYFDDDSTMMVGAGGTAFSPLDKHSIHMDHGRMVAMVGKSNVNIVTNMASVELKTNSTAIVEQKENGSLRVTNISGNDTDITISRNGQPQLVSVAAGQEVILANDDLAEEELIPADGIDRDQIEKSTVISGVVMIKSKPNRQQLFDKDKLLLCSDGSFFKVKRRMDSVRRSVDQAAAQPAIIPSAPISSPSTPAPLSKKSSGFGSSGSPTKLLKSSISESSTIIRTTATRSFSPSPQPVFLPVAHISSTAAGMQSKIASLTTDGALIKHNGKAVIELCNSNELNLKSGSTLISATQPTVIRTDNARVEIAANTIAMVSYHDNVLSVRNFWDTRASSVKVISGKHYVLVPAGQEIVAAPSDEALDKALAADGITRRLAHRVDIPGRGRLHACEFSFISLIQQNDFLNHLVASNDSSDKLLSGKLLKMATCLSQVTARHGRYSVFQPERR